MTDIEEIKALIQRIGETFSHLNMDAWTDCFHTPMSFVMAGEVLAFHSKAEAAAAFSPLFEQLRQQGFTSTDLNSCNVKLLSNATALVAAVWTRFAGEDVLERLGATYFVMKQDGHWKAVMVTSHSPDVAALSWNV